MKINHPLSLRNIFRKREISLRFAKTIILYETSVAVYPLLAEVARVSRSSTETEVVAFVFRLFIEILGNYLPIAKLTVHIFSVKYYFQEMDKIYFRLFKLFLN